MRYNRIKVLDCVFQNEIIYLYILADFVLSG